MPSLICPSPTILDQTFPRDKYQLQVVGEALGEIQRLVEDDQVHLIVSETLQLFVEDFDWDRTEPFPLLSIIFNLLNQWILQPHEKVIILDVSDVDEFYSHPIPIGTNNDGLVDLWAEEVGKILFKHDACTIQRNFFIGIACDQAFAGLGIGQYHNPNGLRVFPLVGPEDIVSLEDAYQWDVPSDIHGRSVPLKVFLRNCKYIGATRVEPPHGDSHYHIYFGNYRWQLSRNDDPTPDQYLRELVEIVDLPLQVIKYVILEEKYPEKRLRFEF